MSSLFLVRHGQASFGGSRYDELSDSGRQQASITGLWFRDQGVVFDRILTGPRKRQSETATLMLSAGLVGGNCAELVSPLDEFGEGEEILSIAEAQSGLPLLDSEKVAKEQVFRLYTDAYLAWFLGQAQLPGRDSFSEFRKRVLNWFETYTEHPGVSGQKTLVVTSAGVISVIVCEALGLPENRWPDFIGVLENASVTEVLYSGSRIGLRRFNGTGHLSATLLSGI